MTAVGVASAVAMLLAAHSALGERAGARDCLLPSASMATARDSAAFCAEAFIERNGYTELPGTAERDMIAVESWDGGHTLSDAVESRRRTIARGPVIACETSTGFSVVFRAYDPMETKNGHVVVMSRRYGDMRLLAGYTRLDAVEPGCTHL
jgi:hypothetical protein